MKKIIIASLVLSCLFFSATMNDVHAAQEEQQLKRERVQLAQAFKQMKFQDFWNNYKDSDFFKIAYGGAYFVEEDLYINIVGEHFDSFITRFSSDSDFKYRKVKYSMNELEETMDKVNKHAEEIKLTTAGIDVKSNSIKVISKLDFNTSLKVLQRSVDMEIIALESSEITSEPYVKYVTNGDRYTINGSGCTVGFAASNSSGDPGFVTAGHCVAISGATTGTNIYYDGYHAGDVDDWVFTNHQYADAAFIELRDPLIGTTWLPSHYLVFGGSYYEASSDPYLMLPGQFVAFHGTYGEDGTENTEIDYGEVLLTSATFQNGTFYIYDMISSDVDVHHGDSGGPLTVSYYGYNGSQLYLYTKVIGILSGGFEDIDTFYFSKIDNICDELDLNLY